MTDVGVPDVESVWCSLLPILSNAIPRWVALDNIDTYFMYVTHILLCNFLSTLYDLPYYQGQGSGGLMGNVLHLWVVESYRNPSIPISSQLVMWRYSKQLPNPLLVQTQSITAAISVEAASRSCNQNHIQSGKVELIRFPGNLSAVQVLSWKFYFESHSGLLLKIYCFIIQKIKFSPWYIGGL